MSLLASVSQRWFGGSPFNYDYGARLEVEHRASSRACGLERPGDLVVTGNISRTRASRGRSWCFPLGASYVLFPTVQVNGLVGYLQQDAAWRISWEQRRVLGRAVGTNVALPWGFTVGAQRRVPVDELRGRVGFPFTT